MNPNDGTTLEDKCCWLTPLCPAMCCHNAILVIHWLPNHHCAVLEHCSRVSKDEVNGATDGAVAVELAMGVDVEGVLVPIHLAVVEDGHVGTHAECHGLVLLGSCGVLEANVFGYEVVSNHSCNNQLKVIKH